MNDPIFQVHAAKGPLSCLVLDSPHSGRGMPADFGTLLSETELRDGEDCFVDELYLPATTLGAPLLAAQFMRTYLDLNRHAGDLDLDMIDGPWPHEHVPSGKARIGKSLLWSTLDDGRAIYGRRLAAAEAASRIERYHRPYYAKLKSLLDAAHARHGVVVHINCHSMNPVSGLMGEGATGTTRADIVVGDRDGSSCSPELSTFVAEVLSGMGYGVKLNDPFKGVELVRAFADPARGRHSLQLEINKSLYMQPASLNKGARFAQVQSDLMQLLQRITDRFTPENRSV